MRATELISGLRRHASSVSVFKNGIDNEREILNVVTSKAPKVASRPAGGLGCCKRPSGERGGVPEKKIMI